jgi:hypothetical protein
VLIGVWPHDEKDKVRNEMKLLREKAMEEMERVKGEQKGGGCLFDGSSQRKLAMMKYLAVCLLQSEYHLTPKEKKSWIIKESVIPCCERMMGVSEEEILPTDALNGEGILLDILTHSVYVDECKAFLFSEEKKKLFGRILTLSGDRVFSSTRKEACYFLHMCSQSAGVEREDGLMKEGGLLSLTRRVGDKKERYESCFNKAWDGIGSFYKKERNAWRKEKGTSKERKINRMREVMWMMEGEGELDASLAFQHHLNPDVRNESGSAAEQFRMCVGSRIHVPLTFMNEECWKVDWGHFGRNLRRIGDLTQWETFTCSKIITSVSSFFFTHPLIFILRAFGNCFNYHLSLSSLFFLVAQLTHVMHPQVCLFLFVRFKILYCRLWDCQRKFSCSVQQKAWRRTWFLSSLSLY